MASYTFPTSIELAGIEQEKLTVLTQDDPIFGFFPIVSKNVINVRFEQRDNITGLQGLRGVDGEPQRVKKVGAKSYMYEPGVYGEFMTLDEKEMMERRPFGTFDGFMDVTDMVVELQDQLLSRRVARIKWILWTLITTGRFYVPLPTTSGSGQAGAGHGDQYANVTAIAQFGMQVYTAGTTWATLTTSTPLQDFRAMQLTGQRGRSVNFGPKAVAIMNQATWNDLIRNSNAADLGGKKSGNFNSTLTSQADINTILLDAGLPQIMIWDDGYIDDNQTFQLWVPNNTVIVIGARTSGATLGEYWMTRNMVNDGAPGAYTFVNDHKEMGDKRVPPTVDVHDGHNGGPILWYPSAIVRMTV